MALGIIKVDSNIEWLNALARVPILGHFALFILVFVPAVIASFLAQSVIPSWSNELGFTKAMFILLPTWNLILWLQRVKLYLFLVPSWIFLGAIAAIKAFLLWRGIE